MGISHANEVYTISRHAREAHRGYILIFMEVFKGVHNCPVRSFINIILFSLEVF